MLTPARPELVPGLLLGERYVLTARLGSGGMGQVWVARDLRLEREVAVKLVAPRPAADGRPGGSALEAPGAQEARLLAALQHPNIVSVYDVGGTGGWAWIVMELVRGESLASLLVGGPLSAARAVRLLGQVLDGLHAAHLVGVVHGDVKPSNILVDRTGVARLVDFGIGRRVPASNMGEPPASRFGEGKAPGAPDRPGAVLGTPGYVAPETASVGGASVSGDIWAAGVVLWESVAGRGAVGPAGGSAARSVAGGRSDGPLASQPVGGRARSGAGRFGEEDLDPLMAAVGAVVRRALATVPEDRFPSAAAMRRALDGVGAWPFHQGGELGALPEVGAGPGAPTRLVGTGIGPGPEHGAAGVATERAAPSGGPQLVPTQALGGVRDGGPAAAGGVWRSREESAAARARPVPSGRGAIVAVAIVGVVLLLGVVVVVLALLGGRSGRPAAEGIHAPSPMVAVSAASGPGEPSPSGQGPPAGGPAQGRARGVG